MPEIIHGHDNTEQSQKQVLGNRYLIGSLIDDRNDNQADVMRQYSTLLNVKPPAMKTTTYSTPFKASINGYCMEILAPHCRHLPRRIM